MRQILMLAAVIFLVVLSGSCFAAEPEADAVLESISYERDADNQEKIIFKLNGAHVPKVFKIKGERPRLVFDFIDTRYSDLINRIIDTKGNLIKGVRVGIHTDPPKTRVVIDLKPEGDFQFEQDFQARENTLSITFHPREPDSEKGLGLPGKSAVAPHAEVAAPAVQPDPVPRAVEPPPSALETPVIDTAVAAQAPGTKEQSQPVNQEAVAAVAGGGRKNDQVASVAPPETAVPDKSPALQPADPVLRDVSFETTADGSEMVLFKLNDFYPPIVFGIEKGNPRVVCDFLDTALDNSVRSAIETKGNYISGIRVARHRSPDKVRVVLDLVPNRNYDLQQVFFKEDNLFIIIINEFEEESVPAAELDREAAPKA